MSHLHDIATFADLMGQRFREAGMNTPRIVLHEGDAEKLRAMMGEKEAGHYAEAGAAHVANFGGVKVFRPRGK